MIASNKLFASRLYPYFSTMRYNTMALDHLFCGHIVWFKLRFFDRGESVGGLDQRQKNL